MSTGARVQVCIRILVQGYRYKRTGTRVKIYEHWCKGTGTYKSIGTRVQVQETTVPTCARE